MEATTTTSGEHIKPVHRYIATRLVLEGGFRPDEITPHPPLRSESRSNRHRILFDEAAEDDRERVILGGLKTKRVDVVVCKDGYGPVLAISVKGTGNAFRNLTNRMEEAIGDSTNVHIMYPGLVYGFLHFLRANRSGEPGLVPNDVSVNADGEVVPAVRRYHDVLLGMTGRRLVRNDYTRYEAVALALVETSGPAKGRIFAEYPPNDSRLLFGSFFKSLFDIYELRFPFVADSVPALRRVAWDRASPALVAMRESARLPDYPIRTD